MGRRGPKAEAQFRYWHMHRQGLSQAEIARRLDISRQAVSKAVKLQEREVLYRLLEAARSSRMLVEWTDGTRGVLVGLIPDLGSLACLMVMDVAGQIRMFYDPERLEDRERQDLQRTELKELLSSNLKVWIEAGDSFKQILERIINE